MKWYVVHTYSGHENRAKKSLEERIRKQGLVDKFGEILIPAENIVETLKSGQKKTSRKTFFPGYILVQMHLAEDSWHLVKSTAKITGFVGDANHPPSIPVSEVQRLMKQLESGTLEPEVRVQFEEGEKVLLIDGTFCNWDGIVEAVNTDKGRLRVLISIFGRPTPVDVGFNEVRKA